MTQPLYFPNALGDAQPSGSDLGLKVRPIQDPATASRILALNEGLLSGRSGLTYSLLCVTGSVSNVTVGAPGRYLLTFMGGASDTVALLYANTGSAVGGFPPFPTATGQPVGVLRTDVSNEVMYVPSGSLNVQCRLTGSGPAATMFLTWLCSGSNAFESY